MGGWTASSWLPWPTRGIPGRGGPELVLAPGPGHRGPGHRRTGQLRPAELLPGGAGARGRRPSSRPRRGRWPRRERPEACAWPGIRHPGKNGNSRPSWRPGDRGAGAGDWAFARRSRRRDGVSRDRRLKARAVVAALGFRPWPTTRALRGGPGGCAGVLSARYAGPGGDDVANNVKLLSALAGVPPARRGAAFVCALALGLPDGRMLEAEALGGAHRAARRGRGGFGMIPSSSCPDWVARRPTPAGGEERHHHRGRALARCWRGLPPF